MSFDETVTVKVRLEGEDNGVGSMLDATAFKVRGLQDSYTGFGKALTTVQVPVGATNGEIEKTGRYVRNAMSPIRTASRDLWSLGYAFRRLNYTIFGSNETMKQFVDILVAAGAALRIVAIMQSVVTSLGGMGTVVKGLSAVWTFFNLQLAQSAFWMGVITVGAAAVIGLAAFSYMKSQAPIRSYATGTGATGVPVTGQYMLHKGETVNSAGKSGTDYSNINIYVTTGALSTRGSVEDLFGEMAIKMFREKRRRGR